MTVGTQPRVDKYTGASQAIEYEHHEIHEGNMYEVCGIDTDLDTAAVIDFTFRTPIDTQEIHMFVRAYSSGATTLLIKEGVNAVVGNGTAVVVRNRNRVSANTSGVRDVAGVLNQVTLGATVGGEGIVLCQELLGTGKEKSSGDTRAEIEWIFRKNTIYLVRLTANADNNRAGLELSWYETRNKELVG